jgi:hypothetical protein
LRAKAQAGLSVQKTLSGRFRETLASRPDFQLIHLEGDAEIGARSNLQARVFGLSNQNHNDGISENRPGAVLLVHHNAGSCSSI